MDNKKLWERVLLEMELTVSKANFATWFKDTYISKQEEGVIYLSVPNAFVKDWLLNKYHKQIFKALRDFGENIRNLDYSVSKDDGRKKEREGTENPRHKPGERAPAGGFLHK